MRVVISIALAPRLLAGCSEEPREPARPAAIAPAIALLDSALTDQDKARLRGLSPDSVILYHHSLGMWLRNEGGLWRGGPVADSLRARGVHHPDDMSHLILLAYRKYLRGEAVDLDSLARLLPPPPTQVFQKLSPPDSAPVP